MFSKRSKKDGPGKPAMPSIIGQDMKIVGDLVSEGEIQVDGTVEGDIRVKMLLIGQSAQITGKIVADVVRVHGKVNGQIRAAAVTLAKTAKMTGDILHENLSIEEGAFLEGHCRRIEKSSTVNTSKKNGRGATSGNEPLPAPRAPKSVAAG